jgi:hypothetical protein
MSTTGGVEVPPPGGAAIPLASGSAAKAIVARAGRVELSIDLVNIAHSLQFIPR